MTDSTVAPATALPSNPFVVESPEKLAPQQIVDLFVESFTHLETVKQRRHTFIWGARGAGKSMMIRYLEPKCQTIVHGGIENFFRSNGSFFAVYTPCKEGQIRKSDLSLLDQYAAMVITEHVLNLLIADRLIDSLTNQFPSDSIPTSTRARIAEEVIRLFDKASIATSVAEADAQIARLDGFAWLHRLFSIESRKVNSFLRSVVLKGNGVYEGATSGYHDFLLPLLKLIQSNVEVLNGAPVYVLVDDADRLESDQQKIVNTWIANRDHSIVCFKISAQRHDYKSFYSKDGGFIEQIHDYTEIDVDELYTASKSNYAEKVKLIAERRLQLSDVPTKSIETFLPSDPEEDRLYEEIKQATALEWEAEGRPGDKGDYIYRLATARLFQRLAEKKRRKSYAGFQNMVHLSSGVVRDFLEPCYLMFDRCISEGQQPSALKYISPHVQNEILFRHSEDFILQHFDDIKRSLPPEKWRLVDELQMLISSLGQLFYARLHDPAAREARLFSFTIRGTPPVEILEVLNLGVHYRYFQLRSYSRKEGGGRERWYILNRLLCPMFKLDPTGFEGRISLTVEALQLAVSSPEQFVRYRLKKISPDETADIHQGELFELDSVNEQEQKRRTNETGI